MFKLVIYVDDHERFQFVFKDKVEASQWFFSIRQLIVNNLQFTYSYQVCITLIDGADHVLSDFEIVE